MDGIGREEQAEWGDTRMKIEIKGKLIRKFSRVFEKIENSRRKY